MKVKLLMNVTKVGNKNDIVEVSDNYAINVLLKQNKAIRATNQILSAKESEAKAKLAAKEKASDAFLSLYENLKSSNLTFKKKVDDKGHLYAKLSAHEFADEVFRLHKVSLDPKVIIISEHDSLGEVEVNIRSNNRDHKLKVKVVKG